MWPQNSCASLPRRPLRRGEPGLGVRPVTPRGALGHLSRKEAGCVLVSPVVYFFYCRGCRAVEYPIGDL